MKYLRLCISMLGFFSILQAHGQSSQKSKNISDTVAYLKTHFLDNKRKYKGEKVSYLLNNLQVNIVSVVIYHDLVKMNGNADAFCIYFQLPEPNRPRLERKEKMTGLILVFSPSIPNSRLDSLNINANGAERVKNILKFYSGFTIQDILPSHW